MFGWVGSQCDIRFHRSKQATTKSVTNAKSLLRGVLPTTLGFGSHGVLKFGLYEALKHQFATAAGPAHAARYRDFLYSASSASAELLACVVLCPFQTVAIRMQTNLTSNLSASHTFANIIKQEGAASLWSGLLPLWSRQIPYTMMKFVAFERIREYLDYATRVSVESECEGANGCFLQTRVRTQHVFLPVKVVRHARTLS
jgi:solute carrier family 25 phosphate transporter 3